MLGSGFPVESLFQPAVSEAKHMAAEVNLEDNFYCNHSNSNYLRQSQLFETPVIVKQKKSNLLLPFVMHSICAGDEMAI